MRRLALGDRVSIDTHDILVRQSLKQIVTIRGWAGTAKREPVFGWVRTRDALHWRNSVDPKTRDGIYIGYRTVSDGFKDYMGHEEGNASVPIAHYRVAVVVLGERENPVYVFHSDIKEETS